MKIELKDVTFAYKKKSKPVIYGANFALESQKLTVLQGANGSGKTTLTKLIIGLIKPQEGEIYFDRNNMEKIPAGQRAESVGYIFQNPDLQFFMSTVKEELQFPFQFTNTLTAEKQAELEEIASVFELDKLSDRFPLTLSGGEKQRLALATVLSRKIKYLILDEPTASADGNTREYIARFVEKFIQNGGGVLLISHDEELLFGLKIDKLLTVSGGKVYEK